MGLGVTVDVVVGGIGVCVGVGVGGSGEAVKVGLGSGVKVGSKDCEEVGVSVGKADGGVSVGVAAESSG